ncbi:amino acid--[acyl-carrier-protein] ligase [Bacillus cereus]|uniref:amino acid--[acyl-carrier-protein] ligase n=1 Tax=Bacillus TaxID=1386 RepID=UPI0002E8E58F|nr:amino acid--[acyl-carrier-protein] ligase [Bacillus cereus]OPA35088.1 hypothetical protein BHL07_27510 [Bacillus cereus]
MEAVLTKSLLDEVIEAGHFIPTGVKGVYGKGKDMNQLLINLEKYISDIGRTSDTEIMMFPPVMNKLNIEKTEYLKSFPHLLGSVHAFFGDEENHKQMLDKISNQEDWTTEFKHTDVVMTPAACYPVYPNLSGDLPENGRVVEVSSFCYRHEPSDEPTRMQSFKMIEFVKAGTPDDVKTWRQEWLEKAQVVLSNLELNYEVEIANDPFFGNGGRLLKINQNQLELKYEIVIPINSFEKPTAVVSSNYHQEHFAKKHQIFTETGEVAHTSCIGFGLERLALALLKTHGLNVSQWPESVKKELDL